MLKFQIFGCVYELSCEACQDHHVYSGYKRFDFFNMSVMFLTISYLELIQIYLYTVVAV